MAKQEQGQGRQSGDAQLSQMAFRSSLKLTDRSRFDSAVSGSTLGPRTKGRLFTLAAKGKLKFPGLLQVLAGKKTPVELGIPDSGGG